MSDPNDIGYEFYAQIGKLERSIAALSMMKEDLRGEVEAPPELDGEMEKLEELFLGRSYLTCRKRADRIRNKLDGLYIRVAHDKAKNPTMEDAEDHLAEIKLFIEELRRKAGNVKHIEKQYDSMMTRYEQRDPKGFFEKASKLRRQLIYFDDMEELKAFLKPIIDEIGELKKEGVHIDNILEVMNEARQRMKEFNVQEGRRVAERVPLMVEGLKEVYGEATEKLTRAVDKLDLADRRGINTFTSGRMLVKAEKYYREGKYNKAIKTLTLLHEEMDGSLGDLMWLEDNLPPLQKELEELFGFELELPHIRRKYSLLRKEVVGGNITKAAKLAETLRENVRSLRSKYDEITKLLPVAQRRFADAKVERKDVTVPRKYFQDASGHMEEGEFDKALTCIKKSIKELLILD